MSYQCNYTHFEAFYSNYGYPWMLVAALELEHQQTALIPQYYCKRTCGNRKKKCSAVDLRVIMTMHTATQTVKCQDAKIYQISRNKRLPYNIV